MGCSNSKPSADEPIRNQNVASEIFIEKEKDLPSKNALSEPEIVQNISNKIVSNEGKEENLIVVTSGVETVCDDQSAKSSNRSQSGTSSSTLGEEAIVAHAHAVQLQLPIYEGNEASLTAASEFGENIPNSNEELAIVVHEKTDLISTQEDEAAVDNNNIAILNEDGEQENVDPNPILEEVKEQVVEEITVSTELGTSEIKLGTVYDELVSSDQDQGTDKITDVSIIQEQDDHELSEKSEVEIKLIDETDNKPATELIEGNINKELDSSPVVIDDANNSSKEDSTNDTENNNVVKDAVVDDCIVLDSTPTPLSSPETASISNTSESFNSSDIDSTVTPKHVHFIPSPSSTATLTSTTPTTPEFVDKLSKLKHIETIIESNEDEDTSGRISVKFLEDAQIVTRNIPFFEELSSRNLNASSTDDME